MISIAEKIARLADIFGGGNSGYGTPLANRNYIVDPNFDQLLAGTITLTASQVTRALTPMYTLSPGTGGTATVYSATGYASNDQLGMYSPIGGTISISPNGDSTGNVAGRSLPCVLQDIEYVQTLQGRSSTFSLWLWTGGGTVTIGNILAAQIFGTGGSPSANVIIDTAVNWVVTTTPQRFSVRVDWPSIAGKVLGTGGNDYIQIGFFLPAGSSVNIGTRQWQLEQSSPQAPSAGLPTAFEYRGAALERIRVQRYWETGSQPQMWLGTAAAAGDTASYSEVRYATTKRAAALVAYAGWQYYSNSINTAFNPATLSTNLDRFAFSGTSLTNWNGWSGTGTWTADARI